MATNPSTDKAKTKKQLIEELAVVRSRLADVSEELHRLKNRMPERGRIRQANLQAPLADAVETAHPGPWKYDVAEALQLADRSQPYHPKVGDTLAEGGGVRVLFVDDHQVMRQGLIRVMSNKPGIQIAGEASNGREAIEQTRLLKPDVIVMDVSMPEMDGIEATRRIRAEFPQVHVIGFSMHEDAQTVQTMREAGAEAFVNKSAASSELLRAICEVACGRPPER